MLDDHILSSCDNGVELPSTERVYVRPEWPLGTGTLSLMTFRDLIGSVMWARNIVVRGCDLVAFEDPEPEPESEPVTRLALAEEDEAWTWTAMFYNCLLVVVGW